MIALLGIISKEKFLGKLILTAKFSLIFLTLIFFESVCLKLTSSKLIEFGYILIRGYPQVTLREQ